MMDFTRAHDRLLKVKEENPYARWPEVLIRRLERRAMIAEVHKANAALRARTA
jgi:hypothetical protein